MMMLSANADSKLIFIFIFQGIQLFVVKGGDSCFFQLIQESPPYPLVDFFFGLLTQRETVEEAITA